MCFFLSDRTPNIKSKQELSSSFDDVAVRIVFVQYNVSLPICRDPSPAAAIGQ